MELEEMKAAWQQVNQRLERSEAVQASLQRQLQVDRTRAGLRGWLWLPGIELGVSLLVAWYAGDFLASHGPQVLAMPLGALPALILIGLAAVGSAASVRQMVSVAMIDHAASVLTIQRRLVAVRALRIRLTQLGLLLWLPLWPVFCVFLVQRGTRFDIYQEVLAGFLFGNMMFGLLLAVVLVWLARRYGDALGRWSSMRKLADSIAGRRLVNAVAQMDALSRFGQEDTRL